MTRWAVSMVVATWPEGGAWTGLLCEHFANLELDNAAAGPDIIERWSQAGRAGHLPLFVHEGPVTVHGRLGLLVPDDDTFVVVVCWTPWQAEDGFSMSSDPQSRGWAEAEVARFLDNPYQFAPDETHAGTGIGLFNKLQHYVGNRRHITDPITLDPAWLEPGER